MDDSGFWIPRVRYAATNIGKGFGNLSCSFGIFQDKGSGRSF